MPKRNLIWIVSILLAVLVTMWASRNHHSPISRNDGDSSALIHADKVIHENSLILPDDREMYAPAIKALVAELDEHSSYVWPDMTRSFSRRLDGVACGLGLEVIKADGDVVVAAARFNSPAHREGILPGDKIVKINGAPVGSMSLCDVQTILDRGAPGTRVELEIVRNGIRLSPVELKMREFAIETVTGLVRGAEGQWIYAVGPANGVTYIRIGEFISKGTADDFQQAMRVTGAQKLILDLRDNPGGPLADAVSIADMFLESGSIVTQVSRKGPPRHYVARGPGTYYPDIPVVVLINSATASAAEIVAGALAYNGRAVLLGEPTMGKRSIQEMFPLPDGLGQLNLTTSYYVFGELDSNTELVQSPALHQPIVPQVPVAADAKAAQQLRLIRLSAAMGPHLEAAHRLGGQCPEAFEPRPEDAVQQLIALDHQLARAIRLVSDPQEMSAILNQVGTAESDASPKGEDSRQ